MSLPIKSGRQSISALSVITHIPANMIKPNPYQPRRIFEDSAMKELVESVRRFGIISPITVRRAGGCFELIAGERRLRAAKETHLPAVPAIIINADDGESALLSLIENVQRCDLSFFEEAESYEKLNRLHGFTQVEIAEKIGKSQAFVANKLRLLSLPCKIRNIIVESGLTERHARALLALSKNPEKQLEAAEKAVKFNLSVSATERLVASVLNEKSPKRRVKINGNGIRIAKNTICKAVSMIEDAGVLATLTENKNSEFMEFIIKVKI